ncbi:serine/threonine-protein kinase [Nocardioides sp. NPDC057767]|uniref:serine/threonine-protein kinase n=1 Tax=unclassified Nocardioides TaxID=2615069 RepID=UPI00366C76E7
MAGEPLTDADPAGFGQVYLATNEAGEDAVAKFIKVVPGADRELLIADRLTADGRPNIVPMLDYGRVGDDWVVVMPRAERSLARHLAENGGSLELEEAVAVLGDIATALASLDGDIVHRDLKPPNILRYNGSWCLTDFGISRYAEATTAPETYKFRLTPAYGAPEQWTGERAVAATDMYAFGIIAFEVIEGRLPFEGPELPDFREQHLHSPVPTISGGLPDSVL